MDEQKVNLWEEIKKNPNNGFKEYFEKEKNYLKNNLDKEDLFLDIGCGDGRTIKIAAKVCRKVYGVDYNEKAVLDCKRNIQSLNNADVFLEDGGNTHFNNEFFDVIFIGLTFSNFSDELMGKILKEIKRILKISGKFIFSCYNENSFDERIELYKKYAPNEFEVVCRKKGSVKSKTSNEISRTFTQNNLNGILIKEGFKILEIKKGKIFYLIKTQKI